MPAEGKTGAIIAETLKTCPAPDQRVASVRTYDPARAHNLLANLRAIGPQASHWSLPEQGHTHSLSPCDHYAVQYSPAHTDATTVGKICVHAQTAADKADPAERTGILCRDIDSQSRQRRTAIRHQPFTARFVDGRPRPIGYHDGKAALTRGNGHGQTSRPATNHENIRSLYH